MLSINHHSEANTTDVDKDMPPSPPRRQFSSQNAPPPTPSVSGGTPMRFVPFSYLCTCSQFPRFPDCADDIVHFSDIDYENSLILFISHNWLRGAPVCEGWDGRPHPDNAAHEKLLHCLEAIKMIWQIMAPAMHSVYVWFDFACINQDAENPSLELEHLDKIMQVCDCVLTPVVDDKWNSWNLSFQGNLLNDYRAKSWNGAPWGYMHRAWCRMEMLYAAFIPLLPSSRPGGERYAKFAQGLKLAADQNRRQHVLFGSKELYDTKDLLSLPPLRFKHLQTHNPEKGQVTKEADRRKIRALMEELLLIYEPPTSGYQGDVDELGRPHGRGSLIDDSGNQYDGQFKHGKKNGKGSLLYCSGDRFHGTFWQDKRWGQGVMHYANGNRYVGGYRYDRRDGLGVLTFADGGYYIGSFFTGTRTGYGRRLDVQAQMLYEGYFLHDRYQGQAKVTSLVDGSVRMAYFVRGEEVDFEVENVADDTFGPVCELIKVLDDLDKSSVVDESDDGNYSELNDSGDLVFFAPEETISDSAHSEGHSSKNHTKSSTARRKKKTRNPIWLGQGTNKGDSKKTESILAFVKQNTVEIIPYRLGGKANTSPKSAAVPKESETENLSVNAIDAGLVTALAAVSIESVDVGIAKETST